MRRKKIYSVLIMTAVFVSLLSIPAYASGDVAGAVESTWSTASQQIKTVDRCGQRHLPCNRPDPCGIFLCQTGDGVFRFSENRTV